MSSSDDQSGKPSPGVAKEDVVLIHGVTEEGDLRVLRKRDDRLEFGAVRPLKEGVPIVGEVVRLTPRPGFPLLCDVETAFTVPVPTPVDDVASLPTRRKGPAQVASDQYRRNWDVIWKRSGKEDLSN